LRLIGESEDIQGVWLVDRSVSQEGLVFANTTRVVCWQSVQSPVGYFADDVTMFVTVSVNVRGQYILLSQDQDQESAKTKA
jgi:hypothetical protein